MASVECNTTFSDMRPNYDKHVKVDSDNIQDILSMIVKHFCKEKRMTYQDATACLTVQKPLSIKAVKKELKKPQLEKKFKWLKFKEPSHGIILFFMLPEQKSILVHLSKLCDDNSEMRIFCKSKKDIDNFHSSFELIEDIIAIYKRKHSKAKLGSTTIMILYPNECVSTCLEYSVFLLLQFFGKVSPGFFSHSYLPPNLKRKEFLDFCKQLNLIIKSNFQNEASLRTDLNVSQTNLNAGTSTETSSISTYFSDKAFLSHKRIHYNNASIEFMRQLDFDEPFFAINEEHRDSLQCLKHYSQYAVNKHVRLMNSLSYEASRLLNAKGRKVKKLGQQLSKLKAENNKLKQKQNLFQTL